MKKGNHGLPESAERLIAVSFLPDSGANTEVGCGRVAGLEISVGFRAQQPFRQLIITRLSLQERKTRHLLA
jgi:hypothetical protein